MRTSALDKIFSRLERAPVTYVTLPRRKKQRPATADVKLHGMLRPEASSSLGPVPFLPVALSQRPSSHYSLMIKDSTQMEKLLCWNRGVSAIMCGV